MAKTKKSAPKKNKDPNAPKRALTPFFIYMQENRGRLKKPGMSVADVAKAAGLEWAKIVDKSEWKKRSAEDKQRYDRQKAESNSNQ